jgi:hypothetical protein
LIALPQTNNSHFSLFRPEYRLFLHRNEKNQAKIAETAKVFLRIQQWKNSLNLTLRDSANLLVETAFGNGVAKRK